MKVRPFQSVVLTLALVFGSASLLLVDPPKTHAAPSIVFPVIGPATFSNDFNSPRDGGIHGATDIIANKMQAEVAAVDGTITDVQFPMPSWGYSINIRDSEGYNYRYIHMNNDNPGTDDGMGGPMNAYAADMEEGNPVVKGQLLGWVGDSGNAENTVPHLHFEIFDPNGARVNPYDLLVSAPHLGGPNPYPQLPNELLPYGPGFVGGVNLTMANVDADPASELIVGAGPGGGPHVRIVETNGTEISGFFAYAPGFAGGVDVAVGDVDGDGTNEIITGAGQGGGPHVRILKLDGTEVGGFYAYHDRFDGGVRVAAADVDGDGKAEIITGAGPGGGPHVRIFKPDGTAIGGFMAYDPGFSAGVDVAAGDVTGTSTPEIVTGPGIGGGPHVRIFSPDGTAIGGFMAYHPNFNGGVRVSVGNVRTSSAKSEILTVPKAFGGPHIRMLDASGNLIKDDMFLEQWWGGFYDVAAGNGVSRAGAGTNRRATIRAGVN